MEDPVIALPTPQFMIFTQDHSPGYWSPAIINYNGSPFMLVGQDLSEIYQAYLAEARDGDLQPQDFRVVNTFYGTLYQLNEDRNGFVEVIESPDLQGADHQYYAIQ